jgi:hypothetical protein
MTYRDGLLRDAGGARPTSDVDALAKDAERYRWLRTFKRSNLFVIYSNDYDGDTMMFDQTLDAAIDAAREKP